MTMTYSEICATARTKAGRATTLAECAHAIADCHDTLRVGQYEFSSPYAVKLWAEIDAYRDRVMVLTAMRRDGVPA